MRSSFTTLNRPPQMRNAKALKEDVAGAAVGKDEARRARAPFLHRRPKLLVHNAKVRHLLPMPFTLGIFPGDPLAGRRVFQKPLPVVNDHPTIKLVVEEPVAALRRSQQRGRIPPAAARSLNPFLIKIMHDRKRAFAGCIFPESAAHDLASEPFTARRPLSSPVRTMS